MGSATQTGELRSSASIYFLYFFAEKIPEAHIWEERSGVGLESQVQQGGSTDATIRMPHLQIVLHMNHKMQIMIVIQCWICRNRN